MARRKRNVPDGRTHHGQGLTPRELRIVSRFFERPLGESFTHAGVRRGVDTFVLKLDPNGKRKPAIYAQCGNATSTKPERIKSDELDELVDKGVLARSPGGVWQRGAYISDVEVDYTLCRHWLRSRLSRAGVADLILAKPTNIEED